MADSMELDFASLLAREKEQYRAFLLFLLRCDDSEPLPSDDQLVSKKFELQQVRERMNAYFGDETLVHNALQVLEASASANEGTLSGGHVLAACRLYFHFVRGTFEDYESVQIPIHNPSIPSLVGVLNDAQVTARQVLLTSSTSTADYDTVAVLIDGWPYHMKLEPNMAEDMVSDLFDRVLPNHRMADVQSIRVATDQMRVYRTDLAMSPISNESSVCLSTHSILRTCVQLVRSVGVFSIHNTEDLCSKANVKVDSSVLVDTGGGVAVEDKSPRVYASHCSDQDVAHVCNQNLSLNRVESGFRSIVLKLSQFMVQKKIQWGYIHGGVHLRIVRVEYKDDRPFIIISSNIPVDSSAPGSMYSLICYMLLTAHEDKLQIFEHTKERIPDPPTMKKVGPAVRRSTLSRVGGAVPEDIRVIVLHTTAGGGSIPIDIIMHRKNSIQGKGCKVDLEVTHFLGAGRFGRVFRCHAFIGDIFLGVVVVKFAPSNNRHRFDVEESAYNTLHCLYDTVVPRFYGHFVGDFEGTSYSVLLLGDSGESVGVLDNLSAPERIGLFMSIWKIHHTGVVHGDIHLGNILRSEQGLRVVDFSLAELAHECQGLDDCNELRQAAKLLNLNSPIDKLCDASG